MTVVTKFYIKTYNECFKIDAKYTISLGVSPEFFDAQYAGMEIKESEVCSFGKLYNLGDIVIPKNFCKEVTYED